MIYFAYGSNLSRFALRSRVPGARPAGRATLPDHMLTFESFDGQAPAYANIRPRPGSRVLGALYEVTHREIFQLDDYEEVAAGMYARVTLNVTRESGASVDAVTYTMRSQPGATIGIPPLAQIEQVRDGYNDWAYDLAELDAALTAAALAASAANGGFERRA